MPYCYYQYVLDAFVTGQTYPTRQSILRVHMACRITPPFLQTYLLSNRKNYRKPKFQILSIFYLSKPKQMYPWYTLGGGRTIKLT